MKKSLVLNLILSISIMICSSNMVNGQIYTDEEIWEEVNNLCPDDSTAVKHEVEAIVENIVRKIGLKQNFKFLSCPELNNAIAAKLPSKEGNGKDAYVIYDYAFLESLNEQANTKWAAIAVIAHEVGHHLNIHTDDESGSIPELEIEADEFAGFICYLLGAELYEAQMIFRVLNSGQEEYDYQYKTHPDKYERLMAIERGWQLAHSEYKSQRVESSDSLKALSSEYYDLAEAEIAHKKKIEYYSISIGYNQKNAFAFLGRAETLISNGNEIYAEQDIKKGKQLNPQSKQLNNLLAKVELKKGNYAAAEEYLNKAIQEDPSSVLTYVNLSKLLLEKKDTTNALKHLCTSISIASSEGALSLRANLYLEKEEYSKALDDINTLILLNPKKGKYYAQKGDCLEVMMDFNKAITSFEMAVFFLGYGESEYYTATQLKIKIAQAYNKLNKNKEALDVLDDIGYYGGSFEYYSLLGDIYTQIEKYEEAIIAYKKAINYDSKNEAVYKKFQYAVNEWIKSKPFESNQAITYSE